MIFSTKRIFTFAFLLISIIASAQNGKMVPQHFARVQPAIVDDGQEITEPFNGTYRFIFTRGVKQVFTDEILKTIELNRKNDEEVTVVLSSYTKLQILSRKQINSSGFIPFRKSYVFENQTK